MSANATADDWRLSGTVLQSDNAAIVVADGEHIRINAGDTVATCQLVSVKRRHALFNCAGEQRRVAIGGAIGGAIAEPKLASIVEAADPQQSDMIKSSGVALDRRTVMGIVQDRQRLVSELPLEPVIDQSAITGYRLLAAPPGGLAVQAGFETGDVVRSVNGEPVHGGALTRMLNSMEGQQQVRIDFERRGEPMQTLVMLR